MKKLLITAATELELALLKKKLSKNKEVDFFVHQVGIPLSLYYLNEYVLKNKVGCILEVGIAGTFDKQFPVASVALIQQDCFGDMGVFDAPHFKTIFEMGYIKKNQKPFQNGFLKNPYLNKNFAFISLPKANAITVQQISIHKKMIQCFRQKYDAHIESMEGACVHFVALKHQIPFLQIRAVSNKVGERDMGKWNIQESLSNLTKEVLPLVPQLTN